MLRAACSLLCLLAVALPAAAQAKRVEIPIKQTVLQDDLVHYSVDVTVGGVPVEVMLDSGSVGLRLLPSAVPAAAVRKAKEQSVYSYGIGLQISGPFAKATVGVGGLETTADVYVQAIERIGCIERRPNCPGNKVSINKFRLGGRAVPDQGYLAIMGVGLRGAGVANPLANIGDGAWIITLPRPGSASPGSLVLNPTAEDRAGYTLFKLQRQVAQTPVGKIEGWEDVLPGCLLDIAANRQVCAPAMLDTGLFNILIRADDPKAREGWKPGVQAALVFNGPGDPIRTAPFKINSDPVTRVFTSEPAGGEPQRLMMGTLPYFSFSVLYDARAGTIGLKRRTG
ncbi:MAG TPA: hypothetical protein VGO52_19310 [Hyphomonadaceae bacterium]|nr:hypothetical protein [Hyphomonadaceae bacterium]